jgi:hypothetical protein
LLEPLLAIMLICATAASDSASRATGNADRCGLKTT